MYFKAFASKAAVFAALSGFAIAPISAQAQSSYKHRQETKNTWRNVAIGSGALGLLGLLKHDNTLMFAGAAGALYSANRYEQDRKSQSRLQRQRAQLFSRSTIWKNGHEYRRRTVWRNGTKYYEFVRVR